MQGTRTMTKQAKIWIYEYKDDDTPVGATFVEAFIEDIELVEQALPHLQEPWHWRVSITWEEVEGC